jgi:hypothetical protein
MQRVNEFSFYELAAKVHPLADIANESKISTIWFSLWEARTAINIILEARPLTVSKNAAESLSAAITAVVPEGWDDLSSILPKEPETEKPVAAYKLYRIRTGATEFETVLAAECHVLDTYFVSKKGAFSTADLVERAHQHIPENTRKGIPEQTVADFDQAGKCLAFDLATAAAFHLLRGTEAVLRRYYEIVVPGPKQAPAKMRNWGVYIKLLADHKAEAKVISLLTHLKDSYRNPVLHPEENYTDESVLVLFGVCVSAIVLMVEEINKASMSLPLAFPPIAAAIATGTEGA